MTRRVTVTIDELVLEGMEARSADLRAAVGRELAHRLAERQPSAARSEAVVDAGIIQSPTGAAIAAAIHRGIAR